MSKSEAMVMSFLTQFEPNTCKSSLSDIQENSDFEDDSSITSAFLSLQENRSHDSGSKS